MAQSIADTLVGIASETAGQAPNIAGAMESGAGLAMKMQQIEQQKTQLKAQEQEHFMNKVMKVSGLYEAASKAEGKGQRFMYDKAIPNTVKALKLEEFFPEATQAMLQSNPAAVPFLVSKVQENPAIFPEMTKALTDPTGEALAKMFPDIQQFGAIQAVNQDALDQVKTLGDAHKFGVQQANAEKRAEAFGSPRAEGVKTQKDEQTARAVSKINVDPDIKQMSQQSRNIEKGLELLKGAVSFKRLAEVSQDIAGALTGKAAASDFKLKHVDTPTFQGKLAELKAFASSNPDQPANPEVVKYWTDMAKSLEGAYHRQIGARAAQLGAQAAKVYANNPNAVAAIQDTVKRFSNGTWAGGQPRYDVGGTLMTADQVKAFTAAHPNLKAKINKQILDEIEAGAAE